MDHLHIYYEIFECSLKSYFVAYHAGASSYLNNLTIALQTPNYLDNCNTADDIFTVIIIIRKIHNTVYNLTLITTYFPL